MSIKSLIGFENLFSKEFGKDILRKPSRLLTGIDPASTKVWNKVLGRDDKPLVNAFGSPGSQYYDMAEAKGIDTGSAKNLHRVADVVAGIYGAQGLAGIGGGGAAPAGAGVPGAGGAAPTEAAPAVGGGSAPSGGAGSALSDPNSKQAMTQAMLKGGMNGFNQGIQQQAPESRPMQIADGTPIISGEAERIRREQMIQAMLAQTQKGIA